MSSRAAVRTLRRAKKRAVPVPKEEATTRTDYSGAEVPPTRSFGAVTDEGYLTSVRDDDPYRGRKHQETLPNPDDLDALGAGHYFVLHHDFEKDVRTHLGDASILLIEAGRASQSWTQLAHDWGTSSLVADGPVFMRFSGISEATVAAVKGLQSHWSELISEATLKNLRSHTEAVKQVQSRLASILVSEEAVRSTLSALDTPPSPQAIQGILATDRVLREIDAEFGLLTGAVVADVMGSKAQSKNRSGFAADKLKAGKLIGFKRSEALVYPGFQFTSEGALHSVIPRLIQVIREYDATEQGLSIWLCSPSGYFDGGRPVDYVEDANRVVEAAEGHYGAQW